MTLGVNGASSKLNLALVKYGLPRGVEASERFEADVASAFAEASAWLAGRVPASFARIRARGIRLMVILTFDMSQDQMEFVFPPEFLLRLGERGLPLHVISND